ncbi:unnamed protein product [Amoebophrya sp. A25]|nr:unnamed protein product [Amoebophrya sp. A25]|eukprot:GSA25T00011110001.1
MLPQLFHFSIEVLKMILPVSEKIAPPFVLQRRSKFSKQIGVKVRYPFCATVYSAFPQCRRVGSPVQPSPFIHTARSCLISIPRRLLNPPMQIPNFFLQILYHVPQARISVPDTCCDLVENLLDELSEILRISVLLVLIAVRIF